MKCGVKLSKSEPRLVPQATWTIGSNVRSGLSQFEPKHPEANNGRRMKEQRKCVSGVPDSRHWAMKSRVLALECEGLEASRLSFFVPQGTDGRYGQSICTGT